MTFRRSGALTPGDRSMLAKRARAAVIVVKSKSMASLSGETVTATATPPTTAANAIAAALPGVVVGLGGCESNSATTRRRSVP